MGPLERAVRDDVKEMGDLVGVEPSLTQLAYRLAQEIDGAALRECSTCGEEIPASEDKVKLLAGLSREIRQTLDQIWKGRRPEDDDDGLGDLDSPE